MTKHVFGMPLSQFRDEYSWVYQNWFKVKRFLCFILIDVRCFHVPRKISSRILGVKRTPGCEPLQGATPKQKPLFLVTSVRMSNVTTWLYLYYYKRNVKTRALTLWKKFINLKWYLFILLRLLSLRWNYRSSVSTGMERWGECTHFKFSVYYNIIFS